ncbi:hypothetical protein FSP39_013062 [Pinctada imbricata]|uniref:Uncharacterized protein n=1 Tax=Pinctada imbricata TaxID=66713 RepID=A0AA89BYL7_PINIB|nr:hypothetical protein FSP39_013062 [Pinctada imbricata]
MWYPTTIHRAPKCIFKDNVGYKLQGPISVSADGRIHNAVLTRTGMTSIYGMNLYDLINITVDAYNEKALRIYIRPQASESHWEISDDLLKMNRPAPKADVQSEYTIEFYQDPIFGIVIKRNSTGTTITLPGMILTEQFLQISTHLQSDYVYGFGEHNHRRFRHDMNWRTWPIFTRDMHPEEHAVGLPAMPPYWSLGFHLCRWGYGNLTNLKAVYQRNKDAGIPQDVQWADIDYMYHKYMFTYDKTTFDGLPEFVDELHQAGQKFIVILDPGIGSDPQIIPGAIQNSPSYNVYTDGINKGVLVKNADNDNPLVGKVWPGLTVFPDFTHPNASAFWTQWIRYFLTTENVKVDGLWIVGILLYTKEKKMEEVCIIKRYVWTPDTIWAIIINALRNIFKDKRPFVMTRSSFAGTGHYSFKWMGDNTSKWPHMHWSIIGILEFGLFGFTMNGADICGFFEDAEREMCIRWFQLGAFYPFSRSHNIEHAKDQDPAAWDDQFIQIVKQALLTRYTLLPYYYTVFKDAHISGTTVMRSLLFEFPEDKNTWNIDKQFLIGGSLLISPVLEEGSEIKEDESGKYSTLSASLDTINVHLRGGSILPVQEPANTTQFR